MTVHILQAHRGYASRVHGGSSMDSREGMVRSVLCFGAQQSMKWCAPKPSTTPIAADLSQEQQLARMFEL